MPAQALAVMKDLLFKSKLMVVANATGATMAFAGSPADAVARARAATPDLVILDLNLPDALATAAALREVAPDARFVGFFAHVQTSLGRTAEAAGIEAVSHGDFVDRLPDILTGKA